MSYTNGLDNPELFFQTLTWSGNDSGTSRAFTFDGDENMSPNLVWTKIRTGWSADHNLFDSVRGAGKNLHSNSSEAEGTNDQYGYVSSFDSDGFTVSNGSSGANPRYYNNENGGTYVAWNWKAGTSFSNDASATGIGTIDSSGSVSDAAGFSIVSYTGNSTSGASIKHGLSSAVKFVVGKAINTAGEDWYTGHASNGFDKYIKLNDTHAAQTFSGVFNDTAPNTSIVTLGSNGIINSSSYNYIMYCFAEKKGYSKFGSYTGNGNADGTFVYTGFKPAWVMVKRTDAAADWFIRDNKQDPENVMNEYLSPNTTATSGNLDSFDFISNGFKIRNSNNAWNGSGNTYIYLAFAEAPFVNSKGVPNNAR